MDLDNHILSVLDEPDLCNSRLGDLTNKKGGYAEASSDDDSDEELEGDKVPASMGYVPLPQNSDEDEDGDDCKGSFLDKCNHEDGTDDKTDPTSASDMQSSTLDHDKPEAEAVKLETSKWV